MASQSTVRYSTGAWEHFTVGDWTREALRSTSTRDRDREYDTYSTGVDSD